MPINEAFGWAWIHLGIVSGALIGLVFLKPAFLGGYDAVPRRLVRLGHISFIGLGAINVLFAHSAPDIADQTTRTASLALIIAAVAMPITCGAVAWRQSLKPLFIVPVSAALLGTGLMAWEMLT